MISILYVVLWVCVPSALVVLGLVLVQRLVPWSQRKEFNDVASSLFAGVLGVYAILLALLVISAWDDREAARDNTEREANAVAEIFWIAHNIPEPEGPHLQELARSYSQTVVDEEWPLMQQVGSEWTLMEQGGSAASDPRAWGLVDEIRGSLQGWQPTTEEELGFQRMALDQVQDLADARRLRLVEAGGRLPIILWALVVVGWLITMVFTCFFGLENARVHRLMVLALSLVLCLAIVTIGIFETPFAGSAQLKPEAFNLILDRFETSELSTLR